MKRFMFLLIILLVVSGCAPDPRKAAEAFAIQSAAEQDALNQAQERKQDAEKHAVALDELQIAEQNKEATAVEWRNALNMTISIGKWFLIAGLFFVLLNAARSISNSFGILTEGIATALARRAEVRANLVYMDPKTRTFPFYIQYLGKGRFSAMNMGDNTVLLLDTRNKPDRQKIAAAGAIHYVGALAQEAAKAKDANSVSLVQTPIIEAKDEMLTVGRDLWRSDE